MNTDDYSLDKLTIVIPSYNRQEFLKRSLNFWSNYNTKVIAIDGSNNSLDKIFLNKLGDNIKYIHSRESFYNRILYATKFISTDYVMLGCDDEFYIPSALNSCIMQLNNNHELASCMGTAMGFIYKDNQTLGFEIYPGLKKTFFDDDEPIQRVKNHLSNYCVAHTYAVCRSSIWISAANFIFSKEYSYYGAWEIQFEFLIPFSNKSMVIPELMWMRSFENIGIRGTSPSMTKAVSIKDWWNQKKYQTEKKDFILRTHEACNSLNSITKNSNLIDASKAFTYLFKNKKIKKNNINIIFYSLYKLFPNKLKKIIKFLFNKLGYTQSVISNNLERKYHLLDILDIYIKKNIIVNKSEIKKILEIIDCFHKK